MRIGVFDSGFGGLSIYLPLRKEFPAIAIDYLGDTRNAPYGTKGQGAIFRYTLAAADFLFSQGADCLVVACNTAYIALQKGSANVQSSKLVFGPVYAAADAAREVTTNKKIGVLSTNFTASSHVYRDAIASIIQGATIIERGAPELVCLVERGDIHSEFAYQAVSQAIAPLVAQDIDTLILGCTHFPLLSHLFSKLVPKGIRIVDSSTETISVIREHLGHLKTSKTDNSGVVYTTGSGKKFRDTSMILFPGELSVVRQVTLLY